MILADVADPPSPTGGGGDRYPQLLPKAQRRPPPIGPNGDASGPRGMGDQAPAQPSRERAVSARCPPPRPSACAPCHPPSFSVLFADQEGRDVGWAPPPGGRVPRGRPPSPMGRGPASDASPRAGARCRGPPKGAPRHHRPGPFLGTLPPPSLVASGHPPLGAMGAQNPLVTSFCPQFQRTPIPLVSRCQSKSTSSCHAYRQHPTVSFRYPDTLTASHAFPRTGDSPHRPPARRLPVAPAVPPPPPPLGDVARGRRRRWRGRRGGGGGGGPPSPPDSPPRRRGGPPRPRRGPRAHRLSGARRVPPPSCLVPERDGGSGGRGSRGGGPTPTRPSRLHGPSTQQPLRHRSV